MAAPVSTPPQPSSFRRWGLLVGLSMLLIAPLQLLNFSAAWLVGSLVACIAVTVRQGNVIVPAWPARIAQGLVGCLIALSMPPEILAAMLEDWPVFLAAVTAVIGVSVALGAVLSVMRILPGTTAIWGAFPGAASIMIAMAEAFGADPRLVTLMQFIRVALVICIAALVSRFLVPADAVVVPEVVWFPDFAWGPFLGTMALAVGGAVIGTLARIPAGAFLVPIFAGIVLADTGMLTITLPPWLMAVSYVLVGWTIGGRFTPDVLKQSVRLLPHLVASTVILSVLCAGVGYVLHVATGIDLASAYLATSPGGADAIAIIAASAPVDVPFVVAMQSARFFLILLIGPPIARGVARLIDPPRKAP